MQIPIPDQHKFQPSGVWAQYASVLRRIVSFRQPQTWRAQIPKEQKLHIKISAGMIPWNSPINPHGTLGGVDGSPSTNFIILGNENDSMLKYRKRCLNQTICTKFSSCCCKGEHDELIDCCKLSTDPVSNLFVRCQSFDPTFYQH